MARGELLFESMSCGCKGASLGKLNGLSSRIWRYGISRGELTKQSGVLVIPVPVVVERKERRSQKSGEGVWLRRLVNKAMTMIVEGEVEKMKDR